MARITVLLFLLLVFAASAQDSKKTILVVPLHDNSIRLNTVTVKNLKYNHVTRDSFAEYVSLTASEECKKVFENYSVRQLNAYFSEEFVPDTFFTLKLWNCFYVDSKDNGQRMLKDKSWYSESYHNLYYGCELTERGKDALTEAIRISQCDYVLFVNEFETTSRSIYSLSCELTSPALVKLYGNKNEWLADSGRRIYYDAVKYFVRMCENDMFLKVRKYISGEY
jgi:hypothetical protein